MLTYPVFYCAVGILLAAFVPSIRSEWFGAIVLTALICVYAFVVKNDREAAIDKRDAGDNCYFIGFVYTMVVIAATLIQDSDILLDKPELLLTTVGVAFSTSVAGMILRFLLAQGEVIPQDEYDAKIRKAAQASHELSGAVEKIAVSAANFSSAAENITTTIKQYEEKIEEHSKNIAGNMKNPFLYVLEDLSEELKHLFKDDLFVDVKNQLDIIIEHEKKTLSALEENLKGSTETLNISAKKAIESATSTKEVISHLMEELKKLNTALVDITKNQQQQSVVTKEQIKVIYEVTGEIDKKIGDLREKYEKLSEKATGQLYEGLIAGADKALEEIDKISRSRKDR